MHTNLLPTITICVEVKRGHVRMGIYPLIHMDVSTERYSVQLDADFKGVPVFQQMIVKTCQWIDKNVISRNFHKKKLVRGQPELNR